MRVGCALTSGGGGGRSSGPPRAPGGADGAGRRAAAGRPSASGPSCPGRMTAGWVPAEPADHGNIFGDWEAGELRPAGQRWPGWPGMQPLEWLRWQTWSVGSLGVAVPELRAEPGGIGPSANHSLAGGTAVGRNNQNSADALFSFRLTRTHQSGEGNGSEVIGPPFALVAALFGLGPAGEPALDH